MRFCPECKKDTEITSVEKTGDGLRYYLKCGHGAIIISTNEIISITENIMPCYDWEFDFMISDECEFNDVIGIKDICLKVKEGDNGSKIVSGFIISVKASTEEDAYTKATAQAKRLTDLIAVYNGIFLRHTLKGCSRINPDQSRTVTVSLSASFLTRLDIPLDLTKNELPSLIKHGKTKSSTELAERLHHANQGFEAQNNELYEIMIREFFYGN
ncbi:MAG: hypothetical protein DA330_10980 [Nitrososphaera sp.]|nr:hypothetical protein [Nitrososphaera sp.]